MEQGSEIPTAVYAAWWAGLIVVVLLVPVAIYLLQRTLHAALTIRRYLAEMEAAGARIAENTAAVSALRDTETVAGNLIETAGDIEQHSRTLSGTLSERARQGGEAS